jgi:hypothetical protein
MTQGPRSNATPAQALEYTEYMVNTFTEGAKQYWRWWGPLGEPMVRAAEQWAQTQRDYLKSLRKSQETASEAAQRSKPRWPTPGMSLPGFTFHAWPGPGDSEGGGWDH